MPIQRNAFGSALLVVGGIVSVQVGAAVAACVFDEVGAQGMTFLRLAFAGITLCAIGQPSLRGRSTKDWMITAGFGTLTAVLILTSFAAVDRLPLSLVVTIELLGPLGLSVAMSRRPVELVWAVVAGVGVLLLGQAGDRPDYIGVVLALVGAASWVGYILLSVETGRRSDSIEGLALAVSVAALLTAPLGILGGGTALLRPKVLLIGAIAALLSSVVGFALELAALRRISARTFGVLMSLSPAIASLAGFAVLDQRLTAIQLTAISLVMIASAATVSSTTAVSAKDSIAAA